MTQYQGYLYPDRTFSLGQVPELKKRPEDAKYDMELERQPDVDYGCLSDWLTGSTNVCGEFRSISERPLFIESPKSSRPTRGKYGKHGITSFGRKFVRNSSLLLEQRYGKRRLGFVTCTLPGFPTEVLQRITGVWGEVVRRFFQKLRRQLKKISKPLIYTSVTEIQEERFKKYGDAVPHLHFIYVCRDAANCRYWLYVCQIHRAWNQAVREGIGLCGYPHTMSSDVPWGSVHCATVRKSASAYLGKYMTKGCSIVKQMKEAGFQDFPRQWWSASTDVKKLFKDSIIYLDRATASSFFNDIEHYLHEGIITWASFVNATINGVDRIVGLVGTLSPQAYASMQT